MNTAKKKKFEAVGWKFGDAADFLRMTPEEQQYIELKLQLADVMEARRKAEGMTQKALAKRLHSSQSRVAFMEKGAPTVSVDLIIRALFSLCMTKKELFREMHVAG